jgi:hypothetical protein
MFGTLVRISTSTASAARVLVFSAGCGAAAAVLFDTTNLRFLLVVCFFAVVLLPLDVA